MIKLLAISGSPVENSSTEVLLRRIESSIVKSIGARKVRRSFVRLNDLNYTPCQACGESPEPAFCFFDDDLSSLYRKLIDCDCLLIGSPIYFDAVSAQTKLFIDRCNCFRPADFGQHGPMQNFVKRLGKSRPGAMVLVGGEKGWFEGARKCIAGFFKWVNVANEGMLIFHSRDYNRAGEVAESKTSLTEADRLGKRLASKLKKQHA